MVEGKADWKPVDGKITIGEWLGYAAEAVPKIFQAGEVKSLRGASVPAIQRRLLSPCRYRGFRLLERGPICLAVRSLVHERGEKSIRIQLLKPGAVEPMTCRLRKDPALRTLLCDMERCELL